MTAVLVAEAIGLAALAVWGAVRHRKQPFTARFFLLLIGGPAVGGMLLLATGPMDLSADAEGVLVLGGAVLGLLGAPVFRPLAGPWGLRVRGASWMPVPTVVAMSLLLTVTATAERDLVTITAALLELTIAATVVGGAVVFVRALVFRRHRRTHPDPVA